MVMAAETPLWKAHDVSQQLQDKIELLPNVERCFVHVDYETTHRPVSAHRCGWGKRLIWGGLGTSEDGVGDGRGDGEENEESMKEWCSGAAT